MPKKAKARLRHNFGWAWFDFDHRANVRRSMLVGIEVEFPPTDEHYLLHIPYKGKDASKAIETAELLVEILNAAREQGQPPRRRRKHDL